MKVLPLIYIEHFTEDEILKHECSDRIWLSRHEFESRLRDAEPGVANMIELRNGVDQHVIGCIFGVHHGDNNTIYVPQWMYDELQLEDEHVTITPAHPGLCTGIMIQPHSSEHVHAEDPQEMLREAFEQYSCLIPETTIPLWIESLQKQVHVTVMEVRPHTGEVRSIRNAEIELELMRPLDMPLPPPPVVEEPPAQSFPEQTVVDPFAQAGPPHRISHTPSTEETEDNVKTKRERAAEAARRRLKAAAEANSNGAGPNTN
jgi:hypothetical protein